MEDDEEEEEEEGEGNEELERGEAFVFEEREEGEVGEEGEGEEEEGMGGHQAGGSPPLRPKEGSFPSEPKEGGEGLEQMVLRGRSPKGLVSMRTAKRLDFFSAYD